MDTQSTRSLPIWKLLESLGCVCVCPCLSVSVRVCMCEHVPVSCTSIYLAVSRIALTDQFGPSALRQRIVKALPPPPPPFLAPLTRKFYSVFCVTVLVLIVGTV